MAAIPVDIFGDPYNWFVNDNTGEIRHITNSFEKLVYETQLVWVRFRTQAEAQAYASRHHPSGVIPLAPTVPTGPTKIGPATIPGVGDAVTAAGSAANSVVSTVTSPLQGLIAFLGKLTEPLFWLRVGEVLIGGAMIIVGLARMTGKGNDLKTATKTAAKALAL